MEIIDDCGKDLEVDSNRKSDGCSESGEHKDIDSFEPDLAENIPPEKEGDPK